MRTSARTEKTISVPEAIKRLQAITILSIGESAFCSMLSSFGGEAHPGIPWIVPISLLAPAAQYWNRWVNKQKDRPTFAEWCKAEGLKVEKPYRNIVEPPKAPEAKPSRSTLEEAAFILSILRTELDAREAARPSPVTLIGSGPSLVRENDARVRFVADSIDVFQIDNAISKKEAYKKIEELSRIAHPNWIPLHENEDYILYLRKADHLDQFIRELPGYLDAIHDDLSRKQVPA